MGTLHGVSDGEKSVRDQGGRQDAPPDRRWPRFGGARAGSEFRFLLLLWWAVCFWPVRAESSGPETILHTFSAVEGGTPSALIQAGDGNFYGTLRYGGNPGHSGQGYGSVYKITPTGSLSFLHLFSGSDGTWPSPTSLVAGADGNLYGTTDSGGANDAGTFFRVAPDGTFATLYSFAKDPAGDPPQPSRLILGSDGNFYGIAAFAGNANCDNCASIFKLSPTGSFTTIYSFTSTPYTYARASGGGLIQGSDGYFYGALSAPSEIFKVSSSGTFSVFAALPADVSATPLLQTSDGSLYATTPFAVYKISSSGAAVTQLYSFPSPVNASASYPSGLSNGNDGSFYGTTAYDPNSPGSIFSITPDGSVTYLYWFSQQDDVQYPTSGMILGRDGKFYGTAPGGAGGGAVFSFSRGFPPAPFVSIAVNPTSVVEGNIVVLNWSSTNATSCTADADWSGARALSGTESLTLAATSGPWTTYTYGLTCSGASGSTASLASVTVYKPAAVTLSANPSTINPGESSRLSWSSTNVESCAASGAWTGPVSAGGTLDVAPSSPGNYTYSLTCSGNGGTTSGSTTISVTGSSSSSGGSGSSSSGSGGSSASSGSSSSGSSGSSSGSSGGSSSSGNSASSGGSSSGGGSGGVGMLFGLGLAAMARHRRYKSSPWRRKAWAFRRDRNE